MKRIVVVALSALLILSGCSKKESTGKDNSKEQIKEEVKEEKKEEKKSIKKDESISEYATVKESKTYDYGSINKQDLGDFIPNLMKKTYGIEEPERSELIVVNINSQDATRLNKELEQMYEASYSEVRYNDDGTLAQAEGLVLLSVEETETTISVVILDYGFILFSDGFKFETHAFVFNKADGHLMNEREILEASGMTKEEVYSKVNEKLSAENIVLVQDLPNEYNPDNPAPALLNLESLYITSSGKLHMELRVSAGVGGKLPYTIEV